MTHKLEAVQAQLKDFFSKKLEQYGATAEGVDYNGEQAQQRRFLELVRIIGSDQGFSVIDYGCGYGAMFDFLQSRGRQFEYYGLDLIEKMVRAGRESHQNYPNAHFTTDEKELPITDYLVAAGIFNIKMDAEYADWKNFTCETLGRMNALCSKGFSFNMLTMYSDAERMAERPDLFYGDPLFFFDYCKRNFSRNVALLHDYDLYDFTILVRKVL
ncbi:MAG TPA: class I SAM-dependent methyltransferase [Anaerolineales bacterium]|nr:class I SAM-dependent methyltransferase [Anaerolineales bacterium]